MEIGSGSGYVTCSVVLLLQHIGVAAHCIATDINPAAMLATEQTLQAHKARNAPAMCYLGNAISHLPVPEQLTIPLVELP